MHRPVLLALAVAAPLAGCAITPLTAGGSQVRVVDAAPPHCWRVGLVRVWTTAPDLSVLDEALRAMRNNAAALGADTLVVGPPEVTSTRDSTAAEYLGTGYRCWPDPVGAYLLARATGEIAVRAGPDRTSPVRRTLAPGTLVDVADTVVNGFRRVHFRDGGPTGFIAADEAVELVR